MSNFLRGKLNDNRLGLALAAFFGWLLSFPMYGRFLLETAGESAPYLGLVFITSQGAGLMILHLLPSRLAANHRIIRSAGIAVAALTVLYAFAQRTMIIDTLIMIVFAFASAYLELAWVTFFAGQTKPLQTLAIAMAGANLVCAAISIPLPLPEELYLTLLAVLAASSVFLFPARNSETTTEGCPLPDSREALKTIAVLAVFVVAVYLIGGIWYDIFALEITASPLMQASTGFLIYSAGIIILASLARRASRATWLLQPECTWHRPVDRTKRFRQNYRFLVLPGSAESWPGCSRPFLLVCFVGSCQVLRNPSCFRAWTRFFRNCNCFIHCYLQPWCY